VAQGLLLAGGYALFLKQKRLTEQNDLPTVVAIERWGSNQPRVTNDFDFIADLDLIASPVEQERVHEVLERHHFHVVPQNARWQFRKSAGEDRVVLLDFHAQRPGEERTDLRVGARRIKPGRSLGKRGIHARENREASGAERHPFSFTYRGLDIVVPNPVTLAVMKLVAMRDRWLASQDASKSAYDRATEAREARKHAADVWRIVAMVTRQERDLAHEVVDAVRATPTFHDARTILFEFFASDETPGSLAVAGMWREEDHQLIQSTLTNWLR
jgi:hypothetical protein